MELYSIILIVCAAITLTGAIGTVYQTYKLVVIDARARGLKHPKLLAFLVAGGQRGEGLILYLIGRRKYPIQLSEADRAEMAAIKKKIGVALVFLACGAIGMSGGIAMM